MLTLVPDFQVIEFGKLNLITFYNSNNDKENSVNLKSNHTKTKEPDTHDYQENDIPTSKTKQNLRSYLRCNYPTWNATRHKHVSDRQVVKCASYRDVGQHDMSLTLSSCSSYMSDSRTTNISLCDNIDHQQCRHLLDESLDRGSSSACSELPISSVKNERKVKDDQVYDASCIQTVTLHEIPDTSDISIVFSETA